MYSIVHVLKDMRPVTLCFADRKSAESFLELVNVYEDDSGAGNGYDGYWPNYEKRKVRSGLLLPKLSLMEIDFDFVLRMLKSIYRARAVDADMLIGDMHDCGMEVTQTPRGHFVTLPQLPPRLRPTVGDMYRMPRSLSPDGMGDEGKVIEDCGGTLKVIPCQYWQGDGFRSDVQVLEVKASSVMKTHDWLREHNPDRTDWTFDPTKILPPEPRMYQSI